MTEILQFRCRLPVVDNNQNLKLLL